MTAFPRPRGLAPSFEDVDLSAITSGARKTIARGGAGLYYSPRGSSQGGLLRVTLDGGGQLAEFGPGDRLLTSFGEFEVQGHPNSAVIGTARLAILPPGCELVTAAEPTCGAPVDLLGTGNPRAFVEVAENTDPDGTNPTGSFDASGWELLRVLVDCNPNAAAANATSFELVPFVSPLSNAQWYEDGLGRLVVPDSDASGFRYRAFTLATGGRGQMCFAIRNLQAAANTALGLIVQGIK